MLLGCFCNAPGSIFEVFSLPRFFFQGFIAHVCFLCPSVLDVQKPHFHWVETHFASNVCRATNDKISFHVSFGRRCSQESCPKLFRGWPSCLVCLTFQCCLLLCLALLLGFLGFSAAPQASEFYVWACAHFRPLGLHVQRYLTQKIAFPIRLLRPGTEMATGREKERGREREREPQEPRARKHHEERAT